MFKKMYAGIAVAAVSVIAAQAMAATATADFKVRITITASCSVVAGAPSDINLGSHASTATNVSNSNNIKVTCSKTTPYFIGLLPSNTNTAGAGVMARTAAPADTVAYQLRQTSATGAIWGNTATDTAVGNGYAGTGSGAEQSIPVYAVVPSANSAPGDYEDTVLVTVNY